MNRRDAAKTLLAAGTMALAGGAQGFAQGARPDPLGRQMLFVDDDPNRTWERLRLAKEAGYSSVEFAGFTGVKPEELRRRVEALGLAMTTMHAGADQVHAFTVPGEKADPALGGQRDAIDFVYTPEGFKRVAAVNAPKLRDAGVGCMIFSGTRLANYKDRDSIARLCDAYNWAADHNEGLHLQTAVHPHGTEFGRLGDGTIFDFMAPRLSPKIKFQLDIGWVIVGGADLYAVIDRYGDRIFSYHLKDVDKARTSTFPDWTPGAGTIDWTRFHRATRKFGAPYYVIEGGSLPGAVQFLGKYGWA